MNSEKGKIRKINYVQHKKFCVYGLICPLTLTVRYIGCTAYLKTRESQHNIVNSWELDHPKTVWIKNLKVLQLRPIPVILFEFDDEKEALKREKELIIKHDNTLFNLSQIRIGRHKGPQHLYDAKIKLANSILN